MADDPRYITNPDRIVHGEALTDRIAAATVTFRRDDLIAALEAEGVPAGPINTVAQAFADAQVIHRGMAVEMTRDGRPIPAVRLPIRFSDADLAEAAPSPGRPNKDAAGST